MLGLVLNTVLPSFFSHRLNSPFKAFTTNLFNVNNPKSIQDTLESLNWNEAMIEEMRALHKIQIWDLINNPMVRRQWAINGCL